MFSDLYNTDILALASTLENTSLPSPRTTARKVSKLCGLKEGAPPPDGQFEKLALLKGVANYPARHASTLLAFEAAVAAFENAGIRLP